MNTPTSPPKSSCLPSIDISETPARIATTSLAHIAMAETAREADADFRPTLDAALLTTIFNNQSAAANVEQSLQATLDKQINQSPAFRSFFHHVAVRELRVLLRSWRLLPKAGEEIEPGHLVDKFEYIDTALQADTEKRHEYDSLEYQLARCLTDEMKKEDFYLGAGVLESVIEGASKKYLAWMQVIDTAQNGVAQYEDIGPEPQPHIATYDARFIPPLPSPTEDETPPGSPSAPAFAKKGRPGNFGHGAPVRWTKQEDYWAKKQIRLNPGIQWQELTDRINAQFEGTIFNAGKKGMIKRGFRSLQAVQKRFKSFRQDMSQRVHNGQDTVDTPSDIEPDNDSAVSYDEASVQGNGIGDEDKSEREEEREDEEAINQREVSLPFRLLCDEVKTDIFQTPDTDEDPPGDLEDLVRRTEEGTI